MLTATLHRLLFAALLALTLSATAPAMAQPAQDPPATAPSWVTSFYKALSYEAVTGYLNLSAMAAYPPRWVTRGYLGLDAATSVATFYVHELAWSAFGPAPGTESVAAVGMGKAITFGALDMVRNFALTLAVTGDPLTASGVATAYVISDTSVYLLNEYGWTLFGPQPPGAATPVPAATAAAPR